MAGAPADYLPLLAYTVLILFIPFCVVLMTSFTRISIVLTFVKQALSTSIPSVHIITGLSVILTGYIMHPVFNQIQQKALIPYLNSEEKHPLTLLHDGWPPLRDFMLCNTREKDLHLFLDLGSVSTQERDRVETFPWYCVVPSFVLSELRIAFLLGFLLFLPFLIIDMVVSSLLMSMGIVLLPPVMISFPFKILLFVIIDGWHLIIQQMIQGYHSPAS